MLCCVILLTQTSLKYMTQRSIKDKVHVIFNQVNWGGKNLKYFS